MKVILHDIIYDVIDIEDNGHTNIYILVNRERGTKIYISQEWLDDKGGEILF